MQIGLIYVTEKAWVGIALDCQKTTQWFHKSLKRQNSVTLSMCEAEFIAIALANQEALYLGSSGNHDKNSPPSTQQLFIVIINPTSFWKKPQ